MMYSSFDMQKLRTLQFPQPEGPVTLFLKTMTILHVCGRLMLARIYMVLAFLRAGIKRACVSYPHHLLFESESQHTFE